MPLVYRAEGVDDLILDHFGIEAGAPNLTEWEALVQAAPTPAEPVRIALVGKYMGLEDAYLSVIEALRHGAIPRRQGRGRLVNSENLDTRGALEGATAS